MIIDDVTFGVELEEVLGKLQRELEVKHIPYLQKVKDSGQDIMVQCPYHGNGQENRPSAGIRKSDGLFHCFACGAVHKLPELVSYVLVGDDGGMYGWKWLLRHFISMETEEDRHVEIDLERNNFSRPSAILGARGNNKSERVTEEELDSYRYYHPYWKERGIINDQLIELFDLGYDKDAQCITFPVRDKNGVCLFVARRSVNCKMFNYPSGVEKPLYGLYEYERIKQELLRGLMFMQVPMSAVERADEVFITESMIDCLLLWQAGYYALALNGTGSENQFKALQELQCRKLILATDNDKAGSIARDKIRRNVPNKICTEIGFPSNRKDVGECSPEEIKSITDWEIF